MTVASRLPKNFHQWNESLDNVYWGTTNAVIIPNEIASPDGRMVADKINETAINNQHFVQSTILVPSSNIVYTSSIYARAEERRWMLLLLNDGTIGVYFDISSGVAGSVIGAVIAYGIATAGQSWYRCWVASRWTAGNRLNGYYIATADGTSSYLGAVNNGIYLWRPQINEGQGPDDSFLTTEVPRT